MEGGGGTSGEVSWGSEGCGEASETSWSLLQGRLTHALEEYGGGGYFRRRCVDTCPEGEEKGVLQGKLAGCLRSGERPLCETQLEPAPGEADTCPGGEERGRGGGTSGEGVCIDTCSGEEVGGYPRKGCTDTSPGEEIGRGGGTPGEAAQTPALEKRWGGGGCSVGKKVASEHIMSWHKISPTFQYCLPFSLL